MTEENIPIFNKYVDKTLEEKRKEYIGGRRVHPYIKP